MKQVLLSATIYLVLLACKKQSSDDAIKINWPCDLIEDSIATSRQLEGSWKWINYVCQARVNKADKDIKVTFNSNGTYIVQENSAVVDQGSWQLKSANTDLFILDLSSSVSYLKGFVFFCENRVLFADEYEGGCNNYFEKTD